MGGGRGDRGERRVLGQIRAGGCCVMGIDGRGGLLVGQRAEDEVCGMGGVVAGVRRVHVAGVGVGVCVRVRVGVR